VPNPFPHAYSAWRQWLTVRKISYLENWFTLEISARLLRISEIVAIGRKKAQSMIHDPMKAL
jgi:hypothetical protein